ncbi:MAG: thiolase family protein [Sphingomonadaceae bacterium]|nr:thiolase family protein [Sphingomonadaceae bacterium]
MNSAVILSAVRTPIATARKGALANTSAEEIALTVLRGAVERSGLSPEVIDDVIFAESLYGGGALARHAAVEAGMTGVSGMAINRHCAGSLTSTGVAAATIMVGMEKAIVAGGVQSSSTAPKMLYRIPGSEQQFVENWMPPTHPDRDDAPNRDMSITVGWNTAQAAGISRDEMDRWALRSHQRAVTAIDAGRFEDEIVPVKARQLGGGFGDFTTDEHPRRDSSYEKLSTLKPLHPEIEGFSITAGNSSGINDAGSAIVLADADFAAAHGRAPLATVRGWAAVGVDPKMTGMAVIDVTSKLLDRAGVKLADIALWEINEAFASVPIAACRAFELDEEKVNVSGSGCSLGHPVAASGGRMIATLIRDLQRRGGGFGVAAMCAGGGQAGAVLIEV